MTTPRPPLKSLDDALAQLLACATVLAEHESVSTFDADGRVLAQDLVSALQVPALDNSAMDGYAVRCADVLHAQAQLARDGIAVRVVSMPSTTVFDRQSVDYKSSVLPPKVPRIAVEAGVTDGWWKYGCAAVVGIDRYGESAPGGVLFKHFRITAENVADVVRQVVRG